MQEPFEEMPDKKFEVNLWPPAAARRWIWSILGVYTFVVLGCAPFIPITSITSAIILPAIFLFAGGCFLYVFGHFSSNRFVYSMVLTNGNTLRYSTIWKTREISLRDIKLLELAAWQYKPNDIESDRISYYGRIHCSRGNFTTDHLSHGEHRRLKLFFSELVAVDPQLELELVESPYRESHWDSPVSG
jgi:hypothetical protein